jgi:hypothetical protein
LSSPWGQPLYLTAKPRLRVLILGSYAESVCKHLEELRDFLKSNGYVLSYLVKDFGFPEKQPNELDSKYNLRKSEYWIPKSDVPIFVFMPNVDNTGVGYELTYLLNNHIDMAWRSVVGISQSPALNISSLLDGLIQRWSRSVQLVYFEDYRQLQIGSRGALTNLLERLYYSVIRRQSSEWEMFAVSD